MTKLTVREIKAASKGARLHDGHGLYLTLTSTDRGKWSYRYRINGLSREMGLGPYPKVSISDARTRHATYQSHKLHGRDPCAYRLEKEKIAHQASFEDGGCSGEIFFYYPNGQIQAVEQFKNNVRHGICKQFSEDGTIVFLSRYENGEEVHNEGNSKLNYLFTRTKKLAYLIYKTCVSTIKLLDKMTEAIMVNTIYRLSDRQKSVIMNILLLVGVGVVNELIR